MERIGEKVSVVKNPHRLNTRFIPSRLDDGKTLVEALTRNIEFKI